MRIDNVVISNLTSRSCTVNGRMSLTTNGSTLSSLAFSGNVNARNQFSTSVIPDFELNVAGVQLCPAACRSFMSMSARPCISPARS